MGTISKTHTFSAGASIIASQHNTNFDTLYNLVNGSIDNDNLDSSAAIVDTKLAQITTASKVHGTSITGLASLPSAAGNLPSANLPDKVVLTATDAVTELTIATGVVTATQGYHTIDTAADGATDDLDTINGGVVGMILAITPANTARTVVAKHGTGNLKLASGADKTLDSTDEWLFLFYDGSDWQMLSNTVANHS